MPAPSASSSASCADRTTKEAPDLDLEQGRRADSRLLNTTVHSLAWKGVTITVPDRKTKLAKRLVDDVSGIVEAGELLAIMGPSGSGKTTLLNYLARRNTASSSSSSSSKKDAESASASASASGKLLLNGRPPSAAAFRRVTRFVEQQDALIGALTVRETLQFAARLSGTAGTAAGPGAGERIQGLIDSFGLTEQADTLVAGSLLPVGRGKGGGGGISGGQKRRLGVASQLVTAPAVLFLDEPTSGLDSVAGWEVVKFLKGVARTERLIVVVSIHQPSTATFNLFDKLLLLSNGKPHYFGPVAGVAEHYAALGHPMPLHVNPAEFLLELVNTDFAADRESATRQLDEMQRAWAGSPGAGQLAAAVDAAEDKGSGALEVDDVVVDRKPGLASLTLTLLHRSFLKSYRDVVVYGIRLVMYTGLAIMMGTVWLRLDATQESIIPFINAIFYGSAFMSFMACAYSPAYLEDYQQYIKEKRNGLYGATAMIVSNFLIGIPYLFVFALVFSTISYWLSNFQPTAQAFFTWVLWVFLDLLAAESLVVLMASLVPSFVVSLALVAFANGLWMSVNGFMVPPTVLNVFYRYVFHYWDYQKYVFENMMVNEFGDRVYSCPRTEGGCQCMWQTDLADQCLIRGRGVLEQYGYAPGYMGKDVGIMMGIIFGYRLAAWIVLKLKK